MEWVQQEETSSTLEWAASLSFGSSTQERLLLDPVILKSWNKIVLSPHIKNAYSEVRR